MRARPMLGVVTTILFAVIIASCLCGVASAATSTTAQRNAISWTWTYNAPGYENYNCLAYALGYTDRWIWPSSWGPYADLGTEVDPYLYSRGHPWCSKTSGPRIIAYGKVSSNILHFSRILTSTTCRAKWGRLERFNHGSWSPYYMTASSYGVPMAYYR